MASLIMILLCVLAVWFLVDSMRTREIATHIGKRACERHEVQFLDGTVALTHVRLRRDRSGSPRIGRIYQFEFSESGENRRRATISMLGVQLEVLQMNLNEGIH